ncbi:MFS transporter [Planomonospora sp. ID67723]|nr:MFS transporter [Planomonospora sp. ID67723]
MLSYGLAGVINALWGSTLPATDARLDLGAGRLGALLMALAVGALAAMPVAGWLAERYTGPRLLRLALPVAALALTGPATAQSFALLTVSAVVLGVLFGTLNVALSLQAVAVERAVGRPVMATVHGVWTLGAVAGGGLVSTGLRTDVDVRVLLAVGALGVALAGLAVGRRLDGPEPAVSTPAGPEPRPAARQPAAVHRPVMVIALGVIGAAAFLTEGAATDWAGVYATRVLGTDPATASLLYTAFFVAMTAMRFAGDATRSRLGAPTTIRLAGGAATLGYVLVLLAPLLPTTAGLARIGCAIAGWVLAGAGTALVWPIVTSTLGAADAAARRLSAATTISYGGGLVGPALIGSVAAHATLPIALLIPAALTLVVAVVAPPVLAAALRETTPSPRQDNHEGVLRARIRRWSPRR